jgi:hypothetical protein
MEELFRPVERSTCFNHHGVPNMAENKSRERSFAWIDKFRALFVSHNCSNVCFLSARHLAFALINRHHQLAAIT